MYLIITSSPNTDGLTAACGKAMYDGITFMDGNAMCDGIKFKGGEAEIVDISKEKLGPCRICGNGWGICREGGKCVIDDILGDIQNKIRASEGVILITPVYWGQPSERMKYFLDRFRRCEAMQGENSAAAGKYISLIAAAGGSGNGTATCLTEMETWCRHVGAIPAERFGVTRFNRDTMLPAIENAGARLVCGKYFKRT